MKSTILAPRTLLASCLASLVLAGCGDAGLESRWTDREIVIDGTAAEWEGAMTYFDEKKVSVGFLNDGDNLYLTFITAQPQQQFQILGRGAILWFDVDGGNAKSFGVHFPLGPVAVGMDDQAKARMREGERPDLEQLVRIYQGTGAQLEILIDETVATRAPVDDVRGIEVAINEMQGALVYEIRVPLVMTEDVDYAIGAEPGQVIGVGLQTPEMDRETLEERMRAADDAAGRGDMGRRGGIPGPGETPPGMEGGMRIPEGIDVWTKVQLAGAPDPP